MFSYWAYIIVGENNTGKTTFQREVVRHLCNTKKKKQLDLNTKWPIKHPRMPRGFEEIFAMNRSFQEKRKLYESVENFFKQYFDPANICLLSSHSNKNCDKDIEVMIRELKFLNYNVGVICFSNANENDTARIAEKFPWDERFWIENPRRKSKLAAEEQIARLGAEFGEMLIARATVQ